MFTILFCSQLSYVDWLQNHLIPCPFKMLTGIDCPGCGFQRALIALFKGDLHKSLVLYPAAIPFIITAVFVTLSYRFNYDRKHVVKKMLYLITGNVILFAYVVKLYSLY